MPLYTFTPLTVTNGGGTVTFAPNIIPDFIRLNPSGGSVTLAANYTLTTSSHPAIGVTFVVSWDTLIDLNGNSVSIFGIPLVQWQLNSAGYLKFTSINGTDYAYEYNPYDISQSSLVDGDFIISQTVSLDKLEAGTSAQLIVCNNSGSPTYITLSADATISSSGALTISNSAINNAKVDAAAAIDRSKLANGTADHVVINSGAGAFSSEAQLDPVRGGTGLDTSASTGFATVSAGTWSVGAISETLRAEVSFESGWQGTYYVRVPYACTVTAAKARVIKAIAGTDDATVTIKDNSGTTMTSGTLTLTAGSAHGTGFTCTPSANNTLTANQEIQLLVAKTTAGGACSVDITITRTA